MRLSSFRVRGKNSRGVVAIAAAVLLGGCSEDPGLQERLNRLQAEMQEKDRQLSDARSALEKTKSELKSVRAATTSKPTVESPDSTPQAKAQFLSREQVEGNYDSASKALQKRLAGELKDYSVENCTQFPVTMPTDEYPYRSKVLLTFRSDGGRASRLEFPVNADTAGKWTFPNPEDIANALAESRRQNPNTNTAATSPAASPRVPQSSGTPSTTSRPPTSNNPTLVPGQTATETRVIDWGGTRPSNNSRPTPSSSTTSNVVPGEQPTPQQSKPPAQTMPSDRDVRVHW